jgi:hypothetical protein
MPDGRGFFSSDKEISLAILMDCKGNRCNNMMGKRPARRRAAVVNIGSNDIQQKYRAWMEHIVPSKPCLLFT